MSGGSFNYLYSAPSEEAVYEEYWCELLDMADFLDLIAPSHPVTEYTKRIIIKSNTPIPDEVAMVWKAAEWYASCDTNVGPLLDALGATAEARIDGND